MSRGANESPDCRELFSASIENCVLKKTSQSRQVDCDSVTRDGVQKVIADGSAPDLLDYREHIPGRLKAMGVHRLRHQCSLAGEEYVAV